MKVRSGRNRLLSILSILLGFAIAITAGLEYRVIAGTQKINFTSQGINPSTITVSEGKTVKLQITNHDSATHNFVIPDFYIFTQNLSSGQTTTIEFEAAKKGNFPYYSDYAQSGTYATPESNYRGVLVVR